MSERSSVERLRAENDAVGLVMLIRHDLGASRSALDALVDLPDPAAAIQPLMELLEERETFIQERARQIRENPDAPISFSESAARDGATADMVHLELTAIRFFLARGSRTGLELVRGTTHDSDVRDDATTALATLAQRPDVDRMLESLRHAGGAVAAKTLGEMREARALGPLIEASRHEFWVLRMNAVEALGKLGDARALEALIHALDDDDFRVKGAAASALARLGGAQAIDPLVARLGVHKGGAGWARVVEALGTLGGPRAEAALTALLEDNEERVRRVADEALKKLRS